MIDLEQRRELVRRYVALPQDKRSVLLERLRAQGIDFSILPITADWRAAGDALPLSAAQQRMWFLWKLDPEGSAYHLAGMLRLRGQLDLPALRASFDALVARHESLRTTFHDVDGTAVQRIHPPFALTIPLDVVDGHDEAALTAHVDAEAQAPFDLEHGPLLRVRLLQTAHDEHVLLLTMHHIIADGWSMGIVIDEFAALYAANVANVGAAPAQLPPVHAQYADYSAWQRNWLDAGERDRQLL